MDTARVLLIVVENKGQRALFNRAFQPTAHHLVFAADGEDAFDRFSEVKPYMIVAHLRAPQLDGGVLCQLVRQRLGGAAVHFVLVADDMSATEGQRRADEVGADLFVPLPATEADLQTVLSPLLKQGRRAVDEEDVSSRDGAADSHPTGASLASTDGRPAGPGLSAAPHERTTDVHRTGPEGLVVPATTDMDTVVSFKSPYFEASLAASMEQTVGRNGHEDQVTQVVEPPSLEDDPAPERATSTVEPPIIVLPPRTPTPDPLEEPRIPSRADPGSKKGEKHQLIAEVPRERTPTGDSGERAPPGPGVRRGLDESQLGKRLAKRVRSMHRRLEEADFYQLLGVDAGADYERIRQAYYELSLEFHPDRFFLLRSGDLKQKIYAIYRKVSEAFRVLGDDHARRAYDANAHRDGDEEPPTTDPSDLGAIATTDRGRRYVEQAEHAYGRGDLNHARLMLSLARSCERNNDTLRAALRVVVHAGTSSV